jgi:hypothetical protein
MVDAGQERFIHHIIVAFLAGGICRTLSVSNRSNTARLPSTAPSTVTSKSTCPSGHQLYRWGSHDPERKPHRIYAYVWEKAPAACKHTSRAECKAARRTCMQAHQSQHPQDHFSINNRKQPLFTLQNRPTSYNTPQLRRAAAMAIDSLIRGVPT